MFDFIEKVIYINLEHRNDRKDQIEKQLSIFPSKKVERFNAIYEINRGHLGCSKSHIEVLKLAIQNNWKNYLVVEDDGEFCNFETGYKVLENLASNPYDVIVLGGTALSCDTSSYKLYNCCCTTAYMVSNHYYSRLLKNFEEGAFFLDKNYNQSELYAIDQYWHSLQRIDNWYCVFPVLFKQISDYSDIQRKIMNKEFFNYTNIINLSPKLLTVRLTGGLGNQLFQLAFLLYASNISKTPIFLDTLTSPSAGHSTEQYFKSLLKKWKSNFSKKTTITLKENDKLAYEDWKSKINSTKEILKLDGYFQRFEYVNLIKDEFISRLTFNESILEKYSNISNKFFIHVRGGDYRGNKLHDIDLSYYYKQCVELNSNEEFVIFTNDIPYAKTLLPEIPIINENEIDSLFLMSRAKGCICANSSFSWWGAYLNTNRRIYFPSKWFNDLTMDTSGYYFKGSKKISTTYRHPLPSIDKIVYINLDNRLDRREQIEEELQVFSPDKVQRFSAIKHDNGAIGCTMSHIAVLEMAIREGWKNVLIVEDDMAWKNYDNGVEILNKLVKSKYDVIMLGGYSINYNTETHKLISAQTTTSYIVNEHYYGKLLNNFKEGLIKFQISKVAKEHAIDQYWKTLQVKDNWYIVELCIQRPSYSDIERKNVDYQTIRKKKNILDILKGKR
jgi:glycosyl transferase family 25